MTKAKSTQSRSDKRNARAKAKKASSNKARTSPSALNKKSFRKSLSGTKLDFDQVLTNAVRDINNRKEVESEITSTEDVLKGLQRTAGEVFKLYSYVTLVEALNKEKIIDHPLVIDLKSISLDLIDIDRRVQNISILIEAGEEETVFTEALDIGTSLQNYAEDLYAEVSRSEKHALIIEESLSRLAKDVEDIIDDVSRRNHVMQNLAYRYLTKVKEENDQEIKKPEVNNEVAIVE